MTFGLTDADLRQIRAVLARFPAIASARIFGSRAKGTHKPGSDVDLALRGATDLAAVVARVHECLNEELPLPYFFDVVDEAAVGNPALREHIARVGRVVYLRADGLEVRG